MSQPLRICRTTGLRPEMRERYLELHAAVWEPVNRGLVEAGVRNFSIFLRGDTLVSYMEYDGTLAELEAALAALDAEPDTQRWLELTGPCQLDPEPGEPGGPWRDLDLVWTLGETS